VIFGVLAVLALLAACGGGGSAEPLSTKQYVTRGQVICRDVQHQLDAFRERIGASTRRPRWAKSPARAHRCSERAPIASRCCTSRLT
jgi:hypothetical protein